MIRARDWLVLGALCAVGAVAQAAEDAIATDRPDFVESSDVVGQGRIQIETSVAFERDEQSGVKSRLRSTPTLLRIGVSENVELRFETDGALRQHTEELGVTTRTKGYADLAVGAKWHVQEGDEAQGKPGIAWLLHVDADSGSSAFRGQGWRPSLRLVAEWELPQGYSLGVMPGVYAEHDELGRRYTGGIFAVVGGKSLTDKLRGFVELSGQELASKRHGGNVVTADTGLAYLLTNSVQIDTAVSRGLSRATPDLSWTIGISARF
ncbi:MAG: transporter [Rubrivivax sp.]|nr:MAG: transporter [Rubrivivax sp.]